MRRVWAQCSVVGGKAAAAVARRARRGGRRGGRGVAGWRACDSEKKLRAAAAPAPRGGGGARGSDRTSTSGAPAGGTGRSVSATARSIERRLLSPGRSGSRASRLGGATRTVREPRVGLAGALALRLRGRDGSLRRRLLGNRPDEE